MHDPIVSNLVNVAKNLPLVHSSPMQTTWAKQLGDLVAKAEGKHIRIDGTEGSATSFALANLTRAHQTGLFVLTDSDQRTAELKEDLDCLAGETAVRTLPSRPLYSSGSVLIDENTSATRIDFLHAMLNGEAGIFISSVMAACQFTLPPQTFVDLTLELKIGGDLDLEVLAKHLVAAGYQREGLVRQTGQFALRGGIADLFPPGADHPLRIEFFGNTIESIRYFNAVSQRSLKPVKILQIPPCSELVFQGDKNEGLQRIKTFGDQNNYPKKEREQYQQLLTTEIRDERLFDILPLIYGGAPSIFEYMPKQMTTALVNQLAIRNQLETFKTKLQDKEENNHLFIHSDLFLGSDTLFSALNDHEQILLEDLGDEHHESCLAITLASEPLILQSKNKIDGLRELVASGHQVNVVCYNDNQKKRLESVFFAPNQETSDRLHLQVGSLQNGFILPDDQTVFIPDRDLFGLQTKRRQAKYDASLDDEHILSNFKEGMYVVHIEHGIGRYHGLKHLTVGGIESDFVELEYANNDRLYLPIYRLNIIQPYSAAQSDEDERIIQLDRLGSNAWDKRKDEARRAVEEMAKELLKLYATRKVVKGFAFNERSADFNAFEAAFPFSETRDQLRTIDQVLSDMETARPMDRLVCGDVGFGKTEVALRAAFRAVLDHKQVAVLVPTTLLAEQHLRTFSQRYEPFGANVAGLSRFTNKKEQARILDELAAGKVDVVVGTHRILSDDVKFADLGLLVIDEEHRFGVKHKERIKDMRAKIDVIAMTATPIPRTLQMSLYGFRDLSIIETPPADRQPIHTYVARFDDHLIRNAILKEMKRSGQVFFVHNRVHTIKAMAEYLNKVVPEAKVGIVHGQQNEADVEKTMLSFLKREIDVLLATTIIESGLDFPNANTILINRADHFGLAQLYQLRGRVGRSTREAHAFLLIPGDDLISDKAQKRLRALRSFSKLGGGYRIALRDLEIRGAGNLLGTKQSGHIKSIGIDLYTDLLEKAVNELKGLETADEVEPDLNLPGAAFIPKDYIGDELVRLKVYQEVSALETDQAIEQYREALQDRFGKPPAQVEQLLDVVILRNMSKSLGIAKISSSGQKLAIQFCDRPKIKPERMISFLSEHDGTAKMLNPTTLSVLTSQYYSAFNAESIKNLLRKLF